LCLTAIAPSCDDRQDNGAADACVARLSLIDVPKHSSTTVSAFAARASRDRTNDAAASIVETANAARRPNLACMLAPDLDTRA